LVDIYRVAGWDVDIYRGGGCWLISIVVLVGYVIATISPSISLSLWLALSILQPRVSCSSNENESKEFKGCTEEPQADVVDP